ncbi:MAG TPA: hypothetical protein VHD62_05265 [Opitutaceae bacterium]|nr:hypothetical protein [Opitutaceae bacterium]
MMRKFLLACGALVLLFAFGGCASEPKLKAQTHATFALDAEKKTTVVKTRFAEEIKLELPPIAEPGFHWQLFAHDARCLHQTSEISAPAGPQRISTVTFIAIRIVPRTLVRFLLVNDDAGLEATPVDRQDVTVQISSGAPSAD